MASGRPRCTCKMSHILLAFFGDISHMFNCTACKVLQNANYLRHNTCITVLHIYAFVTDTVYGYMIDRDQYLCSRPNKVLIAKLASTTKMVHFIFP